MKDLVKMTKIVRTNYKMNSVDDNNIVGSFRFEVTSIEKIIITDILEHYDRSRTVKKIACEVDFRFNITLQYFTPFFGFKHNFNRLKSVQKTKKACLHLGFCLDCC